MEIIVNGGRVTSHVHTISNEKFQANFIPHDPGRHRVDVKFNGEKVPNSPWFVEVKDPNTPLLAPMLVAMGGKGGGTLKRNGENGHAAEVETKTNGFSSTYSSNDLSSSLSNNKFSSSTSKLNSEIKQSSLFQQSKKESNLSSTISSNKYESNNFSSSLKTNGTDDLKKKAVSDYEKTEVGNFSSLNTPSLLLGGSSNTKSSGLEESRNTFSSSTEQLNSGRATYSTTIERSINTGAAYSSLNKPHEARIKGLNNGGSSTMPKSLSSKGVERKASLHAEPVSKEATSSRTNGTNTLSSNFTKSTSALASSSSSSLQTSSSTYSAVKSSSGYAATSSLSPPKPAPAPPSPKLSSYKGTADKCKFVGDTVGNFDAKHRFSIFLLQVRHFNAGKPATFEMFAPGAKKSDVEVNIISEYCHHHHRHRHHRHHYWPLIFHHHQHNLWTKES